MPDLSLRVLYPDDVALAAELVMSALVDHRGSEIWHCFPGSDAQDAERPRSRPSVCSGLNTAEARAGDALQRQCPG